MSAIKGDTETILDRSKAVVCMYTQTKIFVYVCVLLLEFRKV